VQQLGQRDLERVAHHSGAIGWYNVDCWRCFFETGTILGHVEEGEILSSAYVSNHSATLGWIGAFIVSSAVQRRGLGRELIAACVRLHDVTGLRLGLVSTIEGIRLYRDAGFIPVGSTHKLVTERGFSFGSLSHSSGIQLRDLETDDWPEILALDSACVGADRERLLRTQCAQGIGRLVAIDEARKLRGFVFGALDGDSGRLILGPIVSDTTELALALVGRMSTVWDGTMRIDVLGDQVTLITALKERGFTLERECPVMTYGGAPLRFDARYRALVAQALG
ncbi:MAG TPA: GNAT family N-acetyltransferase, partial [Labilithrix sp.]|nr:GNAT family N-acetyltransferase [Labilithrix sp.]